MLTRPGFQAAWERLAILNSIQNSNYAYLFTTYLHIVKMLRILDAILTYLIYCLFKTGSYISPPMPGAVQRVYIRVLL